MFGNIHMQFQLSSSLSHPQILGYIIQTPAFLDPMNPNAPWDDCIFTYMNGFNLSQQM